MYFKFKADIELNEKTDTQEMNRSIRKVIKDYKADNVETKDNIVTFTNYNFSGKCRSSFHYMTIVNKGKFITESKDKITRIHYDSYSSVWAYLIVLMFVCLAAYIVNNVVFFLVGLAILGFGILMLYLNIKNGAHSILKKVKENIEMQNS